MEWSSDDAATGATFEKWNTPGHSGGSSISGSVSSSDYYGAELYLYVDKIEQYMDANNVVARIKGKININLKFEYDTSKTSQEILNPKFLLFDYNEIECNDSTAAAAIALHDDFVDPVYIGRIDDLPNLFKINVELEILDGTYYEMVKCNVKARYRYYVDSGGA